MAEMGRSCAFPVLVQGDWGAPAPTKLLRNKLLCYFQSRKKSGGGECEIQQGSGLVLVCFAHDEVRQRVLSKQNHELDLAEKGTLKLVVQLYEATGAAKEDAPVKEMAPKEPSIIEDQTEEKDVQKVLQKEAANGSEDALIDSQASSLVVLENVNITLDMLMLLVENICDLSGGDFQMEFISERNAAVITFQRSIDATNFLDQCSKNARIKKYKITSRRLELIQMIKIENIPSGVCKGFLTLYFESAKNGGGQVSNIQMLPKEDAAIITFCDHKAVHTILEKQHSLKNQPVLVYPYCSCLETALYGKERPQIKMPEPVSVPLDPYIWQFLQGKDKLMQEIENEMTLCYCELIWPPMTCEQPKITMNPSAALSKQGASGMELIKAWKEKVCSELACIMSKFKTTKCAIISASWETIESTLIKNVLAIPDSAKESVILAGFVYVVDNVEKAIKQHIENVIKDAEKAKETIQQTLSVPPHKFEVLHHILQEENLYQENRDVKCSYNFETKTVQLSGILTDVYRMKSDILEKINNMVETKVNVHPNIFHFLQLPGSGQVSKIFHANNIYASYELELNSVALVGQTPEGLSKAEELMKKCLDHKCIVLEDRELMNKKEWKELLKKLERKHNSGEGTVSIDECLDLEEDAKVIIAGYTSAVADVYQMLSNFVERNTRMLKVIPAKSVAVVQYMEKEKKNSWQDLRRRGVKISFGEQAEQKNIILSGPKAEVRQGATVVEKILSSVHSLNVTFDKPGVKAFFKAREYSYVAEAKNSFNCLIRLQKDDELNGVSEGKENPHAKITLKDGIVVEACKDDLTKYPVDVVVNASNEDLKHIGGLADALSKAAGSQLQKECDDHVKRYGSLRPGCAVITGAGNLPCKQVIHAVGPRWDNSTAQKCTSLLKKAVKESLKLAETYNHRSIAIPAISSGVFGFPMKACAHAIVTAIKENLEDSSENGSLKKICLVDVSEDTVQALAEALCKVFIQDPLPPPPASQSQSANPHKAIRDNLHTVTSPAGLKLMLKKRGIEDATTDVVVSSIGADLKLGVGPLSQALLQKAGPMLQAEFEQAVQGQGAQGGCMIQTGGYNLACKYVLHAIVPQWDAGKGHAMKKLGDIVGECLKKAEELSLSSISFPAIGTGGFAFPKSEVAKLMYDKVFQFRGMKSLQEVHFLLHANDKDNIQAFSEVFGCRLKEIPSAVPSDKKTTDYFGGISSPALGVNEMQIGSIKFQSMTGDITHQDTDVIVNVTNANLNSKSGVSKAILEGGGPEVEMECAALALQPHSGFVTTQGGNLSCKKIIHLVPNSNIRTQVFKVLRECEAKKYRSIAFPAIGTGQAQKNPEDAAEEMMSAISDFAGKESPQYLETVKIIIFQSHLQNAFYEAMKKREGVALPTSESMFSRFKAYITGKTAPTKKKHLLVLDKKVEVAVFEICGENRKKVEDAESWLKTLILGEQAEECITDELIDRFGDTEMQKLNKLQKRLHVAFELKKTQSSPSIRLTGTNRDVLTAVTEIQCLIKKLKEVREEESKATLAKNLVEWQYSKNDVFLAFDMITNLHLEDAKISNKIHVNIQINGKNYRADIKNMCATDDHGKSVKIKRIIKEEGRLCAAFPNEWEDMKGNRVKAVVLQAMSQEYKDLEAKFQLSCPSYKIEQIERIQNPFLWQSYQAKKEDMVRKNGHHNNEKNLFHGTPYSTVIPINNTGFNRSYAGKNAAMIGNGTYFAVNASYSAQDTYSTPDSSGKKYMYVARVLTGDYCVGKHGLITPPSKNVGGFDLFDSVTDNMANPSMFVIFHDAQAYPEYLITFRK
ncbi:protein mono-ADP-ribosyltransferase PARP14-like [Varanus komodoensis]|uniref:Poly [ADP-ribose] polymerase n=2 Tax=Varanus komodoensis TaxID=61221 RepID=A0A8D2IYI3_VARKO|nr:protein mono-ADP-ribosyltransferase PARP14-like [Varanus komodoensis]